MRDAAAADYARLHDAYLARHADMTAAREAGVRSRPMTLARDKARDDARDALLGAARHIYASVAADSNVSDADKIALGVRVRDPRPAPVPTSDVRLTMTVLHVVGRSVTLGVGDGSPRRCRRPAGAIGAFVYSHVGPTYPTDPAAWRFRGQHASSRVTVAFDDDVPVGAQVWVCCAYVTRRGELGPVSLPVTTHVSHGMIALAA